MSNNCNRVTASSTTPVSNHGVKPCRSRVLNEVTSVISKRSFHISGHNGDLLLQNICLSRGWVPLDDVKSNDFFFKWTELRKYIDYTKFREGNKW